MKKRRGYITVNIDVSEDIYVESIIDQIDDDVLIDEIKDRNLESKCTQITNPVIDYNSICDMLALNHHTPINEVMIQLEQHLSR